jgi:2,3-bisphosphoglycerate-dependent phosphoglycerate mutase
MYLEKLSEEQILDRELATAAPQVYRLSDTGDVEEHQELVRSEGRDSGLG